MQEDIEKKKLIADNKQLFKDQISLAGVDLLRNKNTTFMSGDMLRTEISFRADMSVPTAGADGKRIVIDPKFWMDQNRKQRLTVIFHEGFHNIFGHCDKRINDETDRTIWNIAADCVVNAFASVYDIGENFAGIKALWPSRDGNIELTINKKKLIIPSCHEKSAEEVYEIIKKHVEQNPGGGNGKGKGKGKGKSTFMDENGNEAGSYDGHELAEASQEDKNEREQRLRQMLTEHKLRGNMPSSLAEMIEGMLKGKVNFRAELRDMIVPEFKTNQTYSKTNRRSGAIGMTLPGRYKEGIDVVFAIDTSGSIGAMEIKYYIGEVYNLFQQFSDSAVKAKIMFHTMDVYETIDVDSTQDIKYTIQTGGTSHQDVFTKAEEENAKVLICLTDGMSDFPEESNIKKILWIVTNEKGAEMIPSNLGKKIVVDINDLSED